MKDLRVLLVGRALEWESVVRAALGPGDRLLLEGVSGAPADVVISPGDEGDGASPKLDDGPAIHVILAATADASFHARSDAVLLEPVERDDVADVLAAARRDLGGASRDALSPLTSIVAELRARALALREVMEREEAALRATRGPADVPSDCAYIRVDDSAEFAGVVRHEERRACRTGISPLLFEFESVDDATLAEILSPCDVVSYGADGHFSLLISEPSPARASKVREQLAARGLVSSTASASADARPKR